MRPTLALSTAAAVIACAEIASAQTTGTAHTESDDFHIGIGAGLSLLSPVIIGSSVFFAGPFGGGSVVIPLDIAGVIRLEPEISFFHINTTDDDGDDFSSNQIRPALGIFYMFGIAGVAQGTVGARLGPQFISSKTVNTITDPMGGTSEVEVTRKQINFAAGPAIGGEYFPSEYFSIGAEAQINFIYLGEEDISQDPGPDPGSSGETGFAAHSNALIFARVFFL
jgi:hypothetical protein